jgi:hypothetical protein
MSNFDSLFYFLIGDEECHQKHRIIYGASYFRNGLEGILNIDFLNANIPTPSRVKILHKEGNIYGIKYITPDHPEYEGYRENIGNAKFDTWWNADNNNKFLFKADLNPYNNLNKFNIIGE